MFVDGFTCARENIVTEWPMSHTVANFWSMVYDFDVTSVVVLHPTTCSKTSLGTRNFGKKARMHFCHIIVRNKNFMTIEFICMYIRLVGILSF